ncbi:MAG: DUF3575 domain-containing protein [Clostridium sp.]|nr:DUF3575 domain-containing protein [Clostridium sp.]
MKGLFSWLFTFLLSTFLLCCPDLSAQRAAVKTNLLYDVLAVPSLGIEIGLAPKWTLDVSGNYNGWTMSHGRKWKHFLIQPEARYWFCDRFTGHFVGVHMLYGKYNVGNLKNDMKWLGTDFSKLSDRRYQGRFGGLGVAYGYSWILNKNWNVEAELGIGWTYTRYDAYPCATCGTKLESGKPHNYFGSTKAAINLIYCF